MAKYKVDWDAADGSKTNGWNVVEAHEVTVEDGFMWFRSGAAVVELIVPVANIRLVKKVEEAG